MRSHICEFFGNLGGQVVVGFPPNKRTNTPEIRLSLNFLGLCHNRTDFESDSDSAQDVVLGSHDGHHRGDER